MVDWRLQASAIKGNVSKTDQLSQIKVNATLTRTIRSKLRHQLSIKRWQSRGVDAVRKAVARAFRKGLNAVNSPNIKEPLKQGTISQSDAELAVIHACDLASDSAAQGKHATFVQAMKLCRASLAYIDSAMCHRSFR
jgi:hypothetical protein